MSRKAIKFNNLVLIDDAYLNDYIAEPENSQTRENRYKILLSLLSKKYNIKKTYVISSSGTDEYINNDFKKIKNNNLFETSSPYHNSLKESILEEITRHINGSESTLILMDYKICNSNVYEEEQKAKAVAREIVKELSENEKHKIVLFSKGPINKNELDDDISKNIFVAEDMYFGSPSSIAENIEELLGGEQSG